MKQSLQLKIGQQLTMTPQLQQAIRLLQLSTLDLQQEIQEALDSNPLLDVSDDDHNDDAHNSANGSDDSATTNNVRELPDTQETAPKEDSEALDQWNEEIPSELSTDSSWEDTYQSTPSSSGNRDDSDFPQGANDSAEETLLDHLYWQLNLTPMSASDTLIAEALIESINPDGYLTSSLEDVVEYIAKQQPHTEQPSTDEASELELELELAEVEAVLHRIQQFDPPGVAARDLSECLSIQLNQLDPETPWRAEALNLCKKFLHLLGAHDYRTLLRKTRLKEADLQQVILLIQSLNPKPGSMLAGGCAEYVIPDVIVDKKNGFWNVNLNPEIAPKLRINNSYADLIRRADNSADNTYLKNHLQEARWFIKSLHSRNDTLLRVAQEIVSRQLDFFEYGEEGMKPLVLHDIAEAVEMHESTISRVTTQKYMHTPRGIFELKYFFSSHVTTNDGGAASSTAIRALVKKMVAAENSAKPLSDSKIADLLDELGFKVARRTIAKYREAMSIPPSNERKRLV